MQPLRSYNLGHRSSALHVGLRHHLAGLSSVLGGLGREDDVLSLAVHTHSTLLADSHVLGAVQSNASGKTHL